MRIRRLSSRMTALLLAVCMVLQLMPVLNRGAAVAEAADAVAHTVSFVQNGAMDTATVETNGWALNRELTTQAVLDRGLTIDSGKYAKAKLWYTTEKVVFDFRLDHAGLYAVSAIVGQIAEWGVKANMYIDNTLVGVINCASPNDTDVFPEVKCKLGIINLDEGAHTISLSVISDYSYRHEYTYLTSVTFTPTEEKATYQKISFSGVGTSYDVPTLAANSWSLDTSEQNTTPTVLADTTNTKLTNSFAIARLHNAGDKVTYNIKVNMGGTYDLSAVIGKQVNMGTNARVLIDGSQVGSLDFAADDLASYAPNRDDYIGRVTLTAGEHKLTLERQSTETFRRYDVYLEALRLTPAVFEPQETTVNFKTGGSVTYATATLETVGWSYDKLATSTGVQNDTANTKLYPSLHAKAAFPSVNDQIVFRFRTAADGYYMVSAIVDQYEAYGITGDVLIDGISVGSVSFSEPTATRGDSAFTFGAKQNLNGIKLAAGDHVLTIKRTNASGGSYMWLPSVTLTPATEPEIIDFRTVPSGSTYDDVTLDEYGWEFLKDAEHTSPTVVTNGQSSIDYQMGSSKVRFEIKQDGQFATVAFNAESGGNVNVSVNTWVIGDLGFNADIYIDGKLVGGLDCDLPAGEETSYDKTINIGTVNLDPSIKPHKLKIVRREGTGGSGGNDSYVWMKYLTLTPASPVKYTLELGATPTGSSSFTARDILKNAWVVSDITDDAILGRTSETVLYGDMTKAQLLNGEVYAVDFRLPYAGSYILESTILPVPGYGLTGDVYIDGEYVGYLDFNTGSVKTTKPLKSVELDSGVHTLAVKRTNAEGSLDRMWMYNAEFTPVDALPTVQEVRLKVGTSSALVGGTTAVSASTLMSDGSVYSYYKDKLDGSAGDSLTITSSDESVAKLENGVLTALKAGETTIEAVAVIDGKKHSSSQVFKVIELPQKTFKLTADGMFPAAVGRKSRVLLQGAVSNVIVDLSRATSITATSADEDIAAASILHQDGKTVVEITGATPGETAVTVDAELDGLTDSIEIPVTVAEAITVINPYNVPFKGSVAYADMKLSEHGLEIDMEQSSDIFASANTKVYGDHLKFDLPKAGDQVVIRFEVPESGDYALDFTGYRVGAFGLTSAIYIDDKYVGEFDFENLDRVNDNDETVITHTQHLRDVNLQGGVHELKIVRTNGGTYRHSYMWILNLMLTPLAQPATVAGINVDCGKEKLIMGESVDAAFSVRMSDGRDYHFPTRQTDKGGIGVNSMMPENASYADGVVTAGAVPGTAMFEITADMTDHTVDAYWDIQVSDGIMFDFKRDTAGTDPATATMSDDNWMVNDGATTVNKNSANYDLRPVGFAATFNHGEVLAIDLNIPKDGVYDVDVTAMQIRELGMVGDFYIDDTYLGAFDFSHPDFVEGMDEDAANLLSQVTSTKFNTVELTQGTHTLYIKRSNPGTYRHSMIWLDRVVFTQAAKLPEVSKVVITAPGSEIALNHEMQVNAVVWMDNGRPYLFGSKRDGSVDDNNKLVFTSSDTDKITVDQTGIMKGVAVGGSTLTVDAYVRGEKHTQTQEFSTVRVLTLSAAGILQMERTDSMATQITAVLDDVAWDLSQAESITVTPDDPGRVEGVIISEDGNVTLQVIGLRAGETSVTVTAVLDGVTGSVTIPVVVFVPVEGDGDLFLDFRSGAPTSPGGTADAADIATHGWNVNYELSGDQVVKSSQWEINVYGIKAEILYEEMLVLDFMVKQEGNYAVELIGTQVGNFGAAADFYVDDVYMGSFDFAHPTDIETALEAHLETALNSIPLTLGRHTLTLKRVNDGSFRHAYIYWGGVRFSKLDGELAFDTARAQADKTTLIVGESINIYTDAVMTDGSVRNMGPLKDGSADALNSISVSNSDPTVAKLEDGKITALSVGSTTITVTAVVDGVSKSDSVTVTVSDETLDTFEVSLPQDVYVGMDAELEISAKTQTGLDIDPASLVITASSDDPAVAAVSGTTVTGVGEGSATITVEAEINGVKKTATLDVTVSADGLVSISVSAMPRLIRPDSAGTQIKVEGGSFQGQVIDLAGAQITYANGDPDVIDISPTGWVTPKAIGEATVTVTVLKDGFTGTGEITVVVTNGKVQSSLYTPERVEAARENIQNYDWARAEMRTAVSAAEKYLGMEEFLWNSVTTQNLPRGISVGYRHDPEMSICRYCGVDLAAEYGSYSAWLMDPINSPWKIQCPDCRRKFPSNDFWSFYQLGIDEHGNWSYELAKQNHIEMWGGLQGVGYLKNDLYPEVATVKTLNAGRGLDDGLQEGEKGLETVEGWGVDDGFGYKTGLVHTTSNGQVEEAHTYVSYYNRYMYSNFIKDALKQLGLAYVYTGEAKYGRVGAILVDRVADVYPDMKIAPYYPHFFNSDSTSPFGKIDGCIWEYHNAENFARYYDALFPAFDDPYVVSFLSQKAEKYGMANDKSTPELIRQNCEDGILREIYRSLRSGDIYGNFGLHQTPLAVAAVVLDTMPETREMLDYLMTKDEAGWHVGGHTGGDVFDKLLNEVDRDGGTGEGLAPNYSSLWYNTMGLISETLNGYDGYQAADLTKNLKYNKMLEASGSLILTRRTAVQTNDSGSYAGINLYLPANIRLIQAFRSTGNIELAQLAYFQNGNTVAGLREDIFVKDPEAIQGDIQDVIDTYGEYPFDDSVILPDYGFAALRGGSLYQDIVNTHDNQRDVWMQFGRYGTHGHPSALNIGMHAYGVDVAPDLGYPTAADGGDEYVNWGLATINHNLVIVDDADQKKLGNPGTPLHYDDAGRVKLVDVDAPAVYAATDIYRRTLITVEANDDVAYTVDFFRVKGGDEHVYSFHSQSNDIYDYAGFTPAEYAGTYAGESVSYRTLGVANGYSYLTNIRKDDDPQSGEMFVDFAVTDYRDTVKDNKDIHMRMTMLNDFELSEVTLAQGETPNRDGNPGWQEFVLARRSGTDLDSTFTTVLEPYKGERYIESMEPVSVARADGADISSNGDVVRALKICLVGDRTDYVVYATNNNVEYIIDGKLEFQGFAGVCTIIADQVAYTYINDGVKFGELETLSEYTGEIVDFTRDLNFENQITVSFYSPNVDVEALAGRHIYVENDGVSNGMYLVHDATDNGDGTVTLDIGDITLIRAAENVTAEGGDYTYNISPRQWFNIPLSAVQDSSPVFTPVEDSRATVGGKLTQSVSAESQTGNEIVYSAVAMPRGASFDAQSGVITWTPDKYQMGTHHFSIMADDGVMQSTIHFEVEVLAGSANMSSNTTSTPSTPGAGTSSGTSGAETDTSGESGESTGNTGIDAPDTPAERFIDLGGHTWAKEAIYRLVDKGVVNGTSENTYSPAANIKRADFAIMLVRAFGITEGEGENFVDVDPNKYYAEELRAARVSGIVNGIGENKFNPEGEITRQDMMLMLARALDAMEIELSEADREVLAQFADAADISDYAADAVSRVVKDGIIAGANGRINPLKNATRAEVAVMLDRVLAE